MRKFLHGLAGRLRANLRTIPLSDAFVHVQNRAPVTGQHGIPPPPRSMGVEEGHEEVGRWYWDEGQALAEDLRAEVRRPLGVDWRWWLAVAVSEARRLSKPNR